MKALVLDEIKRPMTLHQREDLNPSTGEVVVRLKGASLNRRDYWITQGMYPGVAPPVVLGSDGAGVVTRTSDVATERWQGSDVIINPGMDWGDQQSAQSERFHILGSPRDGTFATEVAVPVAQLHAKPSHLDWVQAAALPLAAATAWRALFSQGQLVSDETVLITGIGGGVATFALQFAVAAGANVFVTSSSPEKIQRAVDLGAKGGVNYRDSDWCKQLADAGCKPHLVIDSAGGDGYNELVKLVRPGGRIVNYGATTGPPPKLDLFKVFWKQIRLQGSTMGSPDDFVAMLNFVCQHKIVPVIDEVFSFDEINQGLDQMKSSPQFGKYAVTIQ